MHYSKASWEQLLNFIGLFSIVLHPRARFDKVMAASRRWGLIGHSPKIFSSNSSWLEAWKQPTGLQMQQRGNHFVFNARHNIPVIISLNRGHVDVSVCI
jgi:hypothetical protein